MESLDTEVRARKTLGTVEYVESSGFAQGVLPTKKDVVQNMLYLLQPKRAGQAQRSKEDAAQLLAEHLQEHWLVCNLHTIATQNIKKLILKMYEEFTRLYQTRKQRQNQAFSERADRFNESSEKLFDTRARVFPALTKGVVLLFFLSFLTADASSWHSFGASRYCSILLRHSNESS
uniref:Uncharacterized protein n=2 Tax=Passeriformes TaxID=9126 RepID=A0A8C5JP60_JUNHY